MSNLHRLNRLLSPHHHGILRVASFLSWLAGERNTATDAPESHVVEGAD